MTFVLLSMERKDDAQPPRSAYEEFIAFLDSKEGKDFARFVDELDEAIDCKYPGWIESTTRKGERAAAKRAGIAEASGELAAEQPARREASRKAEGLDRSDRQHEVESQTASVGEQSP